MKKNYILLLVILVNLVSAYHAAASIAASGELVYELVPGFTNQYKFTYKFYKDCGTAGNEPATVTMCYSNSCGVSNSIVLSKIATLPGGAANGTSVSIGCSGVNTNCTTGSLSGYKEWWYSGNLTLTSTCNSWKFSVNINSRDNAVLNLVNPGSSSLYVETTFNNTTFQNNSSPVCANEPVIYSCLNQATGYPILLSDVNSDSMFVEPIQPRSATSVCPALASNIAFLPATGTITNPFPTGGTFNVSSGGMITFTPTQTGVFAFAIKISEYRLGNLIGTTMRDMHVVVQNCNSTSPVLSVDTTSILSGQLIGGEIKSCMSGTLEFCFGIKSPYPTAKLIASDNHASFAPGATVTYNSTGTDSIRACFSWVLNASDTGLHVLSINVTDTTCAPPGIQFAFPLTIPIRVLNTAPVTTGATRCGPGVVNLSAVGIGNLYWYLDSLGGSTINSGTTFSPNVTSTKTYYVESSLLSSGSVGSVGPPSAPANMATGGLYSQINQWTLFNVLHPCTLHSVVVYPNAAGTVTLQQKNSTGSTILNSTTITVTAAQIGTPVLMILDWPLSVGNNYQLHRGSTSVQLYRSATGISYPYTNFSISITGNSLLNPSYYYWAYNWQISNALNTACTSSRTPVTATVLPQITANISSNTTVCQNSTSPVLTLTGTGGGSGPYTFVYKINNGANQSVITTSGNSVTLAVPTSTAGTFVYKLVSVSNSTCSNLQSDSVTVTVNPITFIGNAIITACNSYTWNGTTYTTNGTYTYTSLNAQGCVNTATLTLTINYNTTNGNATITACNSYVWNGTTYTNSGIYTYTSLNTQGCVNTATLTLTINHSTTIGNEASSACNSYTWNGTTYTSNGSYTYTSLNTQGCVNTATLTLTILTPPTANAGVDKTLNCITTSSTIGTTAISGNTYSWSPSTGLNSSTIAQPIASPASTTNYTVTVTGSNGCTATDIVLVSKNVTPPTADAGIDKTLNCTILSTTIGTTAIAGNSYSWSPATGLSSTIIAQPTANPASTITYTVTVTGTNGCTATDIVIVTRTIVPPTADAGVDKNLACTLTSATIGTTAIGGNTYAWFPSTGLSSATIAQPIASPIVTTSYTVTVTGANNCTATDIVVVNVNTTPPTANAGITASLTCTTPSATIGTSAIAGNLYSWSPASGLSSASVAQPIASPNSSTIYTVTVTGSNGCTATSTVSISVNKTPPVANAGPDKTVNCTSSSTTIGTTLISGNTYSWSPSTGLNSSTVAQPVATPTVTTTYTVTVTGANGCTATDAVVVNANFTNTTSITACNSYVWPVNGTTYTSSGIYTATLTCGTEILNLTINSNTSTGNLTTTSCDQYTWNGTTYTVSGVYNYTTLNTQGCTNISTLNLTIRKNPTIAATLGYHEYVCGSFDPAPIVTLTFPSGGIGPLEYAWVFSTDGGFTNTNIPGATNSTYDPGIITQTTWYRQLSRTSGCINYLESSNGVTKDPMANTLGSATSTACNSYTWNGVTYTSSGVYTHTSINPFGCLNTATLTLTINPITTNGSSTISTCNPYTWNGTTYTTSGTYTQTSLNPQGCLNTAILNLTIHPKPIASIGSNTTVCQNGVSPLITFNATNGTPPFTFTYKINSGGNQTISTTTGTFVSLPVPTTNAGTFIYKLVSVTDLNCSQPQFDSAIIIINPLPLVTASNVNVCVGGSVNLIGSPAGGVFNKPNPYSGPTTSYNYTYTNSNGCTATSNNATISSRPLPTAFVSGGGLACSGLSLPNVTIALTGTPPWNLIYNNGVATIPVNGISASPFVIANANIGTYSVTSVSDAYCAGTANGSASVSILTGTATNLINDLGISELIAPVSDCGLSNNETVTVKISNYGNSCQSGFNVHYQINNGPVVTETINSPSVVPGSFINYSFNTKANLAAVGNYSIKIYTSLAADSIKTNDTLIASVQHYPALIAPGNLVPFNDTTGLDYPINFSWSYVFNAASYDLYIWKFTDTMPSTPTLSSITQINYSYATQNLQYGTKYKWKVVAKLNSCNVSSIIQTFSMRKLPDLIIQQTITPLSGFSESSFAVSWKTKNNGPGKTNANWYETAYLSDAPQLGIGTDYFLGTYGNIGALDSGQFYQVPIKTYTFPQGIQGPHFVIVKADQFNDIKEISESNNLKTSDTIQVTLAPYPDLQVTNVVVSPTTVFSNDSLTVTWKVKNLGTGPTSTSSWNDYIYLDTNANLNVNSSQYMAQVHHSGFMNNVDSYTVTKKILVPLASSGTRYIHVFTDRQNQLFEYVYDSNNIGNSAAITVIQSPLPDLSVTGIYSPYDTLSNGQTFGIQWVVKNEGAVNAIPSWYDATIFSSDTTLTGTISILGTSLQIDTIKSLYTKVTQQTLTVPQNLSQGNQYLFLKTDFNNNVYESTFENNNVLRKIAPIYIANADLKPDLFQAPSSAQSGQTISTSWTVVNNARGSILNNSWNDAIYLSSDTILGSGDILLNTATPNSLLLVGNQYSKQLNVTIPNAMQGNYYLILKTDRFNTIHENNENNNTKYNAISISLAPWADLQVTSLNGPSIDTAGTTILFNAQVKNFGLGNIAGQSWVDAIYISGSTNFNAPGRKLLWSMIQNQNVDAGQLYTILSGANLPSNLTAGQYYLFYVTDTSNTIFENTGENNNRLISSAITIYSQNIDLSVLSAQADTNGVMAGQSINITWTAKNLGIDDAMSYWVDAIYLSNNTTLDSNDVMLGSWTSSPPLLKDSVYTKTKNVTIPNSASGIYYLLVNVDKNHQLNDSIRSNNTFVIGTNVSSGGGSGGSGSGSGSTIVISQPPASDLVPSGFTCPAQSAESQPINISFSIGNTGVGPTLGNNWMDQVYLSTDNILNSGDLQLGSFAHNGVLSSGTQYSANNQVILPAGLSGNYFLLLKADATDMIYEHQHENNNLVFASIYITPQQPSDMTVSQITTPLSSYIAGENMTVHWKISNQGSNIANGFYRDGIYISSDSLWDVNDLLLGLKDGNIALLPADSTSRQFTLPLNNVATGQYYLIVRTDLLNNIVESNESNNIGISVTKINVDVKELHMNVLKIDTITSTGQLYYKLIIPPSLQHETMKLTLKGDSTHNAINKLFLSFATTPTANVYDFSSQQAFAANQEIIVPQLQQGVYYIMAFGNDTATSFQQVSLLAKIIPFSITSVNANHGGNTGGVTIQINGAKFSNTTSFRLIDSANHILTPYSTYFIDETKSFASFNLQNASIGLYDVLAINSSGDTVKLIDGFQVQQGPGSSTGGAGGAGLGAGFVCQIVNIGFDDLLDIQSIAPASVRRNRTLSVTVYFENKGTVDIPIPLLHFVSLGGAPVSFIATDINPAVKDLMLECKEVGGPPDVLRPGANGFFKVYTKSIAPLEFIITE